MLIGVIAANSLWVSPYVFYYTKLLDELGLDYEIVVPDRTPNEKEAYNSRLVTLPWDPRKHPLFNYIRYSGDVRKLALEKYDFLVVLTTLNGVFCCPWLKKHFDRRYILDIRDYTHENHPAYFALERAAVRHSALNVISSSKFRTFLPAGDYQVCHNITTPPRTEDFHFQKANGQVVIGYVGLIAYEEQCRRLMELVHGDDRFAFHFYGTGPAEAALRACAETLEEPRIRFFGPYQPGEKGGIIQKTDILFNAYGNGTAAVRCLLANKLYDALYYRKPLLTSPGTFMAEMGGELAFSSELSDRTALERLWDWYQALDPARADAFASERYAALLAEQRSTNETVRRVLLRQTREKAGGCV